MRTITGYMKVDPMKRLDQRAGTVRSNERNDLDVVIGVPIVDAIAIGFRLGVEFGTSIKDYEVWLTKSPKESTLFDEPVKRKKKPRGLNTVYLSPDGKHYELRIAAGDDHVRSFTKRSIELTSPCIGKLIVPIALKKMIRRDEVVVCTVEDRRY